MLEYLPAIIAFAVGFLVQWFLQAKKSRDELLRELSAPRAAALQNLWKLTTPFACTTKEPLSLQQRREADKNFRKWYFEQSGALFLSWSTIKHYFEAIDCLRDPASTDSALELAFSRIRTALKRDCGIYGSWSGWRRLAPPRDPL